MYNGATVELLFIGFPPLIDIRPLLHTRLSRLLRCESALITQHIIMSSVFQAVDLTLFQNLLGHREIK
jgi:hypothetical protein